MVGEFAHELSFEAAFVLEEEFVSSCLVEVGSALFGFEV